MPFLAMYHYSAAVTLVTLALYFAHLMDVSLHRKKHNVVAPANDGPEPFQRAQRIQINTAEQLIVFLPVLWLAAALAGDRIAAEVGVFWPIGRAIYSIGYYKDPNLRGPGMAINYLVDFALFALCIYRMIWPAY